MGTPNVGTNSNSRILDIEGHSNFVINSICIKPPILLLPLVFRLAASFCLYRCRRTSSLTGTFFDLGGRGGGIFVTCLLVRHSKEATETIVGLEEAVDITLTDF